MLALDRDTHDIANRLGKCAETKLERGRLPREAPRFVEPCIRLPEMARRQIRGSDRQEKRRVRCPGRRFRTRRPRWPACSDRSYGCEALPRAYCAPRSISKEPYLRIWRDAPIRLVRVRPTATAAAAARSSAVPYQHALPQERKR